MKTSKSILVVFSLIAIMSMTAFAGGEPKIIAVINHADWCPACKNNGERAQAALMKNTGDKAVTFIKNDLTNDETKAKSAIALKEAGLFKAMESHTPTGVVYFFNSETKELITKISLTKSDKKLAETLSRLIQGL